MNSITGSNINHFQLLTQRHAVKLERLGLKRKGPSITSMMKKKYGLPVTTSYEVLLAEIDKELGEG